MRETSAHEVLREFAKALHIDINQSRFQYFLLATVIVVPDDLEIKDDIHALANFCFDTGNPLIVIIEDLHS